MPNQTIKTQYLPKINLSQNIWYFRMLSLDLNRPELAQFSEEAGASKKFSWKLACRLLGWIPWFINGYCHYRCCKFLHRYFVGRNASNSNAMARDPWHYFLSVYLTIKLKQKINKNEYFALTTGRTLINLHASKQDTFVILLLQAINNFNPKPKGAEADTVSNLKVLLDQLGEIPAEKQQALRLAVEGLETIDKGTKDDWLALFKRYNLDECKKGCDQSFYHSPIYYVFLMLLTLGYEHKKCYIKSLNQVSAKSVGIAEAVIYSIKLTLTSGSFIGGVLAGPLYYYYNGGSFYKFGMHHVQPHESFTFYFIIFLLFIMSPLILIYLIGAGSAILLVSYGICYRLFDKALGLVSTSR